MTFVHLSTFHHIFVHNLYSFQPHSPLKHPKKQQETMSDATNPSPVTVSKDLEGVPETETSTSTSTSNKSDTEMPSSTAPPAAAGARPGAAGAAKPNTRQRKIAVLTSGGDSAGMNAAGKLPLSSHLIWDEILTISP